MDETQAQRDQRDQRDQRGPTAQTPQRATARRSAPPRRIGGRPSAALRHGVTASAEGVRSGRARPDAVPGPAGTTLTIDSLPPPNTRRWVVRRKAEVLAAIDGGLLTATEACARYAISPEELELWQKSLERAGMAGLRVTRIQLYQAVSPAPRPQNPAPPEPRRRDLSLAWDS